MKKHWFYLFILLCSCSGQDNNLAGENIDELNADTSDSLANSNESDEINKTENFSIEEMPSNWTALTDVTGGEGEFAIQKSCYGGIPFLSFHHEIGHWWLTYFSGIHEFTWEIVSFQGQITDNFGSELIKGVIILENQNTLPSDTINFSWTTGQKMCQFNELNMANEYFVSTTNKSHYAIIEAECED